LRYCVSGVVLLFRGLSTPKLRRFSAFYVRAHDETVPHAAFDGETPDERYFRNGDAVVIDLAVVPRGIR
jgi:hypothetical protein